MAQFYPALSVSDTIIKVDPSYYRPAEVETLLGDPSLAADNLGLKPEISIDQMIEEIMSHDLAALKSEQ